MNEELKIKEQEIGLPLLEFLRIFKKGIYVCNESTNNKLEHWSAQQIKVIDAGYQWDICKIGKGNKYVNTRNYGKTWWIDVDITFKIEE